MKLITLNLWGGKVIEPLTKFVSEQKDTVDIFCLQEVFDKAKGQYSKPPQRDGEPEFDVHTELKDHLQSLLPDHDSYFCNLIEDYFGLTIFIRKNIDVRATGEISVYDNPLGVIRGGTCSRKMQWMEISHPEHKDKTFSIMNVHGLWNGQGKTDTPERIEQSRRIKEFMGTINGPKILCGDFNLSPDTQSLIALREGMRDLVQESGATTTRTSYYTRASTSGAFADYIFVSPEVIVNDFKVMPDEVSDHAALYVDFE